MPQPVNPQQSEIALNERFQMEYLFGNPPSWMMRYGISMLADFFSCFWICPNPDTYALLLVKREHEIFDLHYLH
ncbi:MAG: hypothetical protein ACKVU2_16380 [Saprospiraceae bacterium]